MHSTVVESPASAAKPAAKQRSAPLDARVADRLLDLLSTDDHFRRLFKKNRHAALVLAGYPMTEEELHASSPLFCLVVEKLATKKSIASAREALKTYLMSSAIYTNPHCFEAGKMRSALHLK